MSSPEPAEPFPSGGPAGRVPRPPRIHVLVDAAIAFLAVGVPALLLGAPLWTTLLASFAVGLLVAPWTQRAEVRALLAPGPHDGTDGPGRGPEGGTP